MNCPECGPLDYDEAQEDPETGAWFCGLCGGGLPRPDPAEDGR